MKITAETKVSEALNESKEVQAVFNKYNLDCPTCKGSDQDTIAKSAQNNGLDLNAFLEELNKAKK